MSSSDARRQRQKARKVTATRVEQHTCRFCGKVFVIWPGTAKVSHETPPCDGFKQAMEAVAKKHGVTLADGKNYPALLITLGEADRSH